MRIFSGIRPSGQIHIGNYLGAIKQWLALQDNNEPIFCIVDLHAITTPYEPKNIQNEIKQTLVAYLALGLNPEKSIIFVQSHVKEHTELAWLLSTVTSLGSLRRMTQFKEKSQRHPKNITAGLLNYPVLMAADILLYNTDAVPVGEDQAQHVELTREIVRRFNYCFGKTFKEPRTILPKQGKRIMSLTEPRKKMSKSDSPASCIYVSDNPDEIKKKIMSAQTDTEKEIKYEPKKKPGISNLLVIFSEFSGTPIPELEEKFRNKGYKEFKEALTELLIKKLGPVQKEEERLIQNEVYLDNILKDGQKRARAIAEKTITEVKQKMGLIKNSQG